MSRTQGRYDNDTARGDGQAFFSALNGTLTSGTATATRNASGSFSLNLGNSATCILAIPLTALLFRYGVQDWLQEQFGAGPGGLVYGAQGRAVGGYQTLTTASAAVGSNVNIAVGTSTGFTVGQPVMAGTQQTFITAIPDATHITVSAITATLASGSVISQGIFTTPAGVTGAPPYTGVNSLVPVTAPRPKGLAVRAIYPVYSVAGAALTTNTIGLTKTVFANITAPTVTSLITNGANGLATATNAQPYITPINLAVPAVMQVTKFAEFVIEWDVTTASGGTAELFGVFIDFDFNYN